MTVPYEGSGIERARRAIGRAGYLFALVGLAAGTVMFLAGSRDLSGHLFRASIGILLVMPVINVVAVLAEEVARRDWGFVGLAAGALTVLAYALLSRL